MSSINDIRDCLLVAIGRGSPGTARDLLTQFEAAVRADQRERDASLAAGISFLDGHPDAEGEAMAEAIRRHPFPGGKYPDPVRKGNGS